MSEIESYIEGDEFTYALVKDAIARRLIPDVYIIECPSVLVADVVRQVRLGVYDAYRRAGLLDG